MLVLPCTFLPSTYYTPHPAPARWRRRAVPNNFNIHRISYSPLYHSTPASFLYILLPFFSTVSPCPLWLVCQAGTSTCNQALLDNILCLRWHMYVWRDILVLCLPAAVFLLYLGMVLLWWTARETTRFQNTLPSILLGQTGGHEHVWRHAFLFFLPGIFCTFSPSCQPSEQVLVCYLTYSPFFLCLPLWMLGFGVVLIL